MELQVHQEIPLYKMKPSCSLQLEQIDLRSEIMGFC